MQPYIAITAITCGELDTSNKPWRKGVLHWSWIRCHRPVVRFVGEMLYYLGRNDDSIALLQKTVWLNQFGNSSSGVGTCLHEPPGDLSARHRWNPNRPAI